MAIHKNSTEDAKTLDGSQNSPPKGSKASAAKSNGSKPSVEDIRTRAYEIFQARHEGPGNEIGDWQKAEASIAADSANADAPEGVQPPAAATSPSDKPAGNATDGSPSGLTSEEVAIRLKKFGPNAMPDTTVHPLRSALSKFWTPVPWMLEAAIVLEVVLGKYVEAADHRGPAGVQRRARVFSGVARAGDSCGAEVAVGAERVGPARRCLEDCARGRIGAGRYREAVAGCRGGGRRAPR